jgi:hypothetical protein
VDSRKVNESNKWETVTKKKKGTGMKHLWKGSEKKTFLEKERTEKMLVK